MTLIKRKPPVKPLTGAQKTKAILDAQEHDRLQREYEFERQQEEHERNQWRRNVSEVEHVRTKSVFWATWQARGRKSVPYVPLVIVNGAALTGQFSWALQHLVVGMPETIVRTIAAVVYAIAVESIALFLQYYANRALKNRDSAGLLYLSAFLVAGLVSLINFSHFHVPDRPLWDVGVQATAYAFAMCSLISPWLWRVHSRAEHREVLKAAGEIDSRGVKLSLSRKIWHPIKSIRVVSMAAWSGETNPAKAVETWELAQATKEVVEEADEIREEAHRRRVDLKNQRQPRRIENLNGDLTKHPKYTEGMDLYKLSLKGPGKPLSQRALAARLGQKNRDLARQIIRDVGADAV